MARNLSLSILATLLVLMALAGAGRVLVINRPGPADVIVVLAGEAEQRPERGLELLRKGFASRLLMDVPGNARIYQWSQLELAQRYVQQLPGAAAISVCPITATSTKGEVQDVARCLESINVHTVLLVTSEYHSRRALSTFGKLLPRYRYEVAAVSDANAFGVNWWQHREWAKTALEEWAKLIWWEAVERWSSGVVG
jgi:uncharacterized SAM-binding protein YcdF (DUF218 family)